MPEAATQMSIDEAVQRAAGAAEAFAAMPAEDRAALLETMADKIDALGDRLTETAHRETHLPAGRLNGERGRTVNQLRLFASVVREGSWVDARIDPALPDREPLPRPDLRRMLVPLGPIAVFGASNFPLAFSVAGGDTASALAAGCPVVCKAHPGHPDTSELVADAIAEALKQHDAPEGVFTLVHTESNEQNLDLVRHPAVQGVGFTGSHRAGRALFDAALRRDVPIPVFAEMSSVNPMVLLPGAVAERTEELAKGLYGSFTLGVGQFCTKPGVVFTLAGAATEALIDKLAEHTRDGVVDPMLHDGIASDYRHGLQRLSGAKGVETVAQADVDEASGAGRPALLRTTAAAVREDPKLLDECFGPVTLIVVADDLDEVATTLETMQGQLTATLHTGDGDTNAAARLLPVLRRLAGRVLFNGFPTGVEVSHAMQHGGPYPATTDPRFTSVGTAAILRWARPVCYQNTPADLLPPELQDTNPRAIWRTVDGERTREGIDSAG